MIFLRKSSPKILLSKEFDFRGKIMISTTGFSQLVSSPLSRFYGAFETMDRLQFPTRASSLKKYGVDETTIAELTKLAGSAKREAYIVATFILLGYKGRHLCAEGELNKWIKRKGVITPKLEERLRVLFNEYAERDAWNCQYFALNSRVFSTASSACEEGGTHHVDLAGCSTEAQGKFIPPARRPKDQHLSFLSLSAA